MNIPSSSISLQDAAKSLYSQGYDTGPEKLFAQLRSAKVLMCDTSSPIPHQDYLIRGWFYVHHGRWIHPSTGEVNLYSRTFITQKGIEAIKKFIPLRNENMSKNPTNKKSLTVPPTIRNFIKVQHWKPITDISMPWDDCIMGF